MDFTFNHISLMIVVGMTVGSVFAASDAEDKTTCKIWFVLAVFAALGALGLALPYLPSLAVSSSVRLPLFVVMMFVIAVRFAMVVVWAALNRVWKALRWLFTARRNEPFFRELKVTFDQPVNSCIVFRKIAATRRVLEALQEGGETPNTFLMRHASGDWGEVDDNVRRDNDLALRRRGWLVSAYPTAQGKEVCIVTNVEHSFTILFLSKEHR